MFWNCSSLAQLDAEDLNVSNVTAFEGMFSGCSSLKRLDLGTWNVGMNVRYGSQFSMRDMFKNCSSLESLTFGDRFSTVSVTDMSQMFYGTEMLRSLDLHNFRTTSAKNMSAMFAYCGSKAGSIKLDLRSFETPNVEYMNNMFYGCTSLEELNLSTFNTQNVNSLKDMFSYCNTLLKLHLSNKFTAKTAAKAFLANPQVISVMIPNKNHTEEVKAAMERMGAGSAFREVHYLEEELELTAEEQLWYDYGLY
jgi:surface protein